MRKVILHIFMVSSLALLAYSGFAQNAWIDSLKKVVVTEKADTNKILTLQHISNYYSFNNPDSGILYAKEAIALAEKLEYDRGIFWSIVSLDHSLYISGNYSLELEYALKALPIAKRLNDQYAIGWSNGMICDSYLSLGDFNTGMIYIREVLKIMKQSFPDELFSGYAVIVPTYVALHQYDSALICARKSLALLKENPGLYNEDYWDSKCAKNQVYMYLGEAFEANAYYDSALFYYKKCLPFYENVQLATYRVDTYNGIAKVYKEKNNPDSATWYAKKVLTERIIDSYPAAKLKTTSLLADIYESQKNADSSLKYLKMTVGLRDGIYNREKTTAFQNSLLKEQGKQKEIQAVTIALQNRYRMYLLIGLIIISIIIAAIVIRNRRIKQMQKMRNSIADDLHDDIGSSLSSISIMSELAKAKSPQAEPLLASISENTSAIQENMSDIIWAVNPQNDRFENVLQRMNLFAAEILEAKNIQFEFTSDPSLAAYRFTMKQRKNLYLFFKEAINNAAKYSDAGKVFVRINKKDNHVEMNISDNGKGFDTTGMFNGNGLNTFKKRAEELNAEFKISSPVNEGTTVQLKFKIT
ncbi:MAG: ATP-binding protein [Chitinophagaceae bacterium]